MCCYIVKMVPGQVQFPQTTAGWGSEINIRQELFLIGTLDGVTLI